MMFKNMKLGVKMTAAFAMLLVVAVIIGLVGYNGVKKVNNCATDIYDNHLAGAQALLHLHAAQMDIGYAERTLLAPGIDKQTVDSQYAYMTEAWKVIDENWKTYEGVEKDQEETALWNKFGSSYATWKKNEDEFLRLYKSGNLNKAREQSLGATDASFKETEAALEELLALNAKIADEMGVEADSTAAASKRNMVLAIGICILLAIGMGVFFSRHVGGIISSLINETKRLVGLAVVGKLDSRGDVEKINTEFQGIIQGMNEIMDTLVSHINAVPVPVMIIDKDFTIQYMNGTGAALLALTQQQVVGTKCYDHFKTSDCHTTNCACATAMQHGRVTSRETDAHPRGMDLDIAYTGIPVKDANGQIVGCMEFVVDQTAVKTAAQVAQKQADYQEKEVQKLIVNLSKLAKGDLHVETKAAVTDVDTKVIGENFTEINNSLNETVNAINLMVRDANMLSEAAIEGRLSTRADASRHGGEFRNIVDGFNRTLDTLVGHIDSVPAPFMILDKDFSIRYLNKTGLDLLGMTGQQAIGTKCYTHFKTSDCNTANCACAQAMQQGMTVTRETDAHPRGMNLDITYTGTPLKDAGGKTIGVAEFVVDQTAIKTAARVAQKQADYQEKEVQKLIVNLGKLAKGDLRVETRVAETDEDTKAIGDNFTAINNSLSETVGAINLMAEDARMLSEAAVEGKLDTRADALRHGGEFRVIIEGVNQTLDAVVHPINEAAECLKEMAKGNLDVAMTGNYKGDHALIKNALNATIDSVNEILSQVSTAVDQVANGSRQISDSSQALSQGASESASSLEEITSSMQQVTTQTKQNADNATHANQLAGQARVSAEKGNGQMVAMVNAMNQINECANDISRIIKAIDEIAFQTNLLALNAAVEAARAGKHGKGFAVVAEEVRNLAERSAKAAKETAELIEGSIKKTEVGTKIVEETSKSLEEIVAGATKVTDLIGEIASASKEQAFGIGQINQGLSQVDQVTQQNTASAEELAAASEELSAQAVQLKQMLGKFRLKAQQAYPSGPASKAGDAAWGAGALEAAVVSGNAREKAKPKDVIHLDDKEFGKF
ncbi:MAG: methyl-accepting chemotaxis protein [Bacillota bacterium]